MVYFCLLQIKKIGYRLLTLEQHVHTLIILYFLPMSKHSIEPQIFKTKS